MEEVRERIYKINPHKKIGFLYSSLGSLTNIIYPSYVPRLRLHGK